MTITAGSVQQRLAEEGAIYDGGAAGEQCPSGLTVRHCEGNCDLPDQTDARNTSAAAHTVLQKLEEEGAYYDGGAAGEQCPSGLLQQRSVSGGSQIGGLAHNVTVGGVPRTTAARREWHRRNARSAAARILARQAASAHVSRVMTVICQSWCVVIPMSQSQMRVKVTMATAAATLVVG